MSAFMCSVATIDVIVTEAIRWESVYSLSGGGNWYYYFDGDQHVPARDPDSFGRMLLGQNLRSLIARYGEEEASRYPEVGTYRYRRPAREVSDAEVAKALACYVYQSCEDEGWRESEAYEVVEGLKDQLLARLPGYDEAEWDFTDENIHKMVVSAH